MCGIIGYKEENITIGHQRWALENFNNCHYFQRLKYPAKDRNLKMNILNLIKKKNYYVLIDKSFQKFINDQINSCKEVFSKLKISRITLHRIRKKENYWCNLSVLIRLTNILNIDERELITNIKRIKTKNSFPINFIDINLNESLAKILGHILGDGGIHTIEKEGKHRAFYVNNESILLDSFKLDIEKIFGKENIYFRKREGHGDEIWLPSTMGFILYRLLEYDKFKEKRVPSLIKKSNDEKIIGSFLQALYDDEGFLYPNKKMIVISLANLNLLKDIRNLIFKLGIIPNKILVHQPKNRSKMYYFSITKRENFIRFKDQIGFIHPIKRKKLELLLDSYGDA